MTVIVSISPGKWGRWQRAKRTTGIYPWCYSILGSHSSSGHPPLPAPEFRHLPGHHYYRTPWAVAREEKPKPKRDFPPLSLTQRSPLSVLKTKKKKKDFLDLFIEPGVPFWVSGHLWDYLKRFSWGGGKKQKIMVVFMLFWILISFSHSPANIYFSESSDSCFMPSVQSF